MTMNDRTNTPPPPTADEVLAFFDGKLEGAEQERVRELLIVYPELARVALMEMPETDDAAQLSDEELAADWASLQAQIRPAAPSSPTFWRSLAIAATIAAVILGAMLFRSIRASREPVFIPEAQLLLPNGGRGPESVAQIPAGDDDFVLQLSLISQPAFPDYRITIQDASARTLWTGRGMHRRSDDTFAMRVSRALLPPGKYRVVVDGLDGARTQELGRYDFVVAAR
jgi:hypothetical protein